MTQNFLRPHLSLSDKIIKSLIDLELNRQQNSIELIASENIVSNAVLEAQGSILTNKYAEGYPGKRYYGGCEFVDQIELLAIERLKTLYSAKFANVQAHSGSQANQAVFLSLLNAGDTIVSLSLDCGGHLTHGSKVSLSGKWFNVEHYFVGKDGLLDYTQIKEIVTKVRPKLVIAGGSSYPRKINFAKLREIADLVGSYLLADIAHISGIVATGHHQNPIHHADVVTSTTHKTLRGPRGGFILTNHESIFKKINAGVFPGIQGGPLMHVIAAKAVAFNEALQPSFKHYINQVLLNAQILASELLDRGCTLVTGGTDTHLLLIDLTQYGLSGKFVEESLDELGLTCNKNSIPFDATQPFFTSGIRLGTASATTRGMKENDFKIIAHLIADIIDDLVLNKKVNKITKEHTIKEVYSLCKKFPIY